MSPKSLLKALFACILVSLVIYTAWAGTRQSVFAWRGLTTGPDRYWTTATLLDAYCGFTTFYVWVFYKERGWVARLGWFFSIMLLGNIAMSSFVLLQLARLRPDQPATDVLLTRTPRSTRP